MKVALVVSSLVASLSAQSAGRQVIRSVDGHGQPSTAAIKAGGFVYVTGVMATDLNGDIRVQTKQVFETLRGVLRQAGSSIDNIAVATVTLQQASDVTAMDAVYREQFTGDPPARTIAVGNMVRPGALIQIGVTATPDGESRRAITPAGWLKPAGPYSYAIQSGDTLFLSAMAPRNYKDPAADWYAASTDNASPPSVTRVHGDTASQVMTVMSNAAEVLKAAGMSLDDTVTSRVLLRYRVAELRNMNRAYSLHWKSGRPTRATVGLGLLGTHDVEITFVAVKALVPRETVTPPNADGSPAPEGADLVNAFKIGNRLWVSGNLGRTPQNEGDLKAQTTEVIVNRLQRSLKAAGFELKDVVATEVWMTDVSQYDDLLDAYRSIFPTDQPVRSITVGAESIGHPGQLEVALMAVK